MPAIALMLAAMWIFDKPGARYAFLAGVLYSLAIQTRYTSLFLLGYFFLDTTLSPKKIRRLGFLLAGAGVTIAPYLLWIHRNYGSFTYPFAQARRIVHDWTVPVPASFYWNGLREIFPYSIWLLFAFGVLLTGAGWARRPAGHQRRGLFSALTDGNDRTKRRLVLLLWGVAFFVYMLTTPHKEVRYLLPTAIPIVAVSAAGLDVLWRWCCRRRALIRAVGLLVVIAVVTLEYAPSIKKLRKPWVDRTVWEAVEIGTYLQRAATPADTIYTAHNFPVFAFYSARRTVSLLPIQGNFGEAWHEVMDRPGFLVYYRPAAIGENHSHYASFKPDQAFLEANPNFHEVRAFPSALVYRYDPKR